MFVKYLFEISGKAANDQTWEVSGHVEGKPGNFPDMVHEAMRDGFQLLTQGRARFGHPGVGCNGPYTIAIFKLTEVE